MHVRQYIKLQHVAINGRAKNHWQKREPLWEFVVLTCVPTVIRNLFILLFTFAEERLWSFNPCVYFKAFFIVNNLFVSSHPPLSLLGLYKFQDIYLFPSLLRPYIFLLVVGSSGGRKRELEARCTQLVYKYIYFHCRQGQSPSIAKSSSFANRAAMCHAVHPSRKSSWHPVTWK